jgi:hypothetical protein
MQGDIHVTGCLSVGIHEEHDIPRESSWQYSRTDETQHAEKHLARNLISF